jgi:hypothetical protein
VHVPAIMHSMRQPALATEPPSCRTGRKARSRAHDRRTQPRRNEPEKRSGAKPVADVCFSIDKIEPEDPSRRCGDAFVPMVCAFREAGLPGGAARENRTRAASSRGWPHHTALRERTRAQPFLPPGLSTATGTNRWMRLGMFPACFARAPCVAETDGRHPGPASTQNTPNR